MWSLRSQDDAGRDRAVHVDAGGYGISWNDDIDLSEYEPTRGCPVTPQEDAQPRSFTALQGQYLAFIRAYTLIHREPPAEVDMQRFFRVTPPSVHRMVLTLAERGLVERTPGRARSLRVLVPPDELPPLEEPA